MGNSLGISRFDPTDSSYLLVQLFTLHEEAIRNILQQENCKPFLMTIRDKQDDQVYSDSVA